MLVACITPKAKDKCLGSLRAGWHEHIACLPYVGLHHVTVEYLMQGYIFGGLVAGPLGWRAAFLLEAAAMVPFVLFCALAPPMNLKGMDTGMSLQMNVPPEYLSRLVVNCAALRIQVFGLGLDIQAYV